MMLKPAIWSLLATATLALTVAHAQPDPSKDFAVEQLSDQIYMLQGSVGNVGLLVGDDGAFLIDDDYAPMTPKLMEALEGLDIEAPAFVLNTHYHADHTGGNEGLGGQGSLLVAHENVRRNLLNGTKITLFDMVIPPVPPAAAPLITYQEGVDFHLNGERVQAIHLPNAHTDGDSIIYFHHANVIHTGDVFFNGFFPFIDVEHGGTLAGTIAALEVIADLATEETQIIPGHGPLASKQDVLASIAMLTTAHERLRALQDQGMSAEEATAENPLADMGEEWGQGFFTPEQWVGVVYGGLD